MIINSHDMQINIEKIRSETAALSPLIHCITNPISINDCANTVLLTGAKPVMAEHPDEAAEITGIADVLAVNLGNITDARLKSIRISSAKASERAIPSIIDIVGITCSSMRLNYARQYLADFSPSVIKGNLAEIKALCGKEFSSTGIDAISDGDVSQADCELIAELAASRRCVVMATGKTDIISDGSDIFLIKNGSPKLPLITGTGCMLNVLTACFLAKAAPTDAALTACLMLGICGELADLKTQSAGLGSFHIALLDELSLVTTSVLCERANAIRSTARSI